MLSTLLLGLLQEKNAWISKWLSTGLAADSVEAPRISGGSLQIRALRSGREKTFAWSDTELLSMLSKGTTTESLKLSTGSVWSICKFSDVSSDTDRLLRTYIAHKPGVTLEDTPFILEEDSLSLECDKDHCSGELESTEDVVFELYNDRLRVVVPLESLSVRELLLERLRRIVL